MYMSSILNKLSKLSAESAMTEVTVNNVWFLSVALILIPQTSKDDIPQLVLSDCRYLGTVISYKLYL